MQDPAHATSLDALRPWLWKDPLTVRQAAMLAVGYAPDIHRGADPFGYNPLQDTMMQAAQSGKLRANIQPPGTYDPPGWTPGAFDIEVTQADVKKWLREIGYTDAFFFLTDPSDWPKKDKESITKASKLRSDREQNLLRVIAALWALSKLPPEHNTAAKKLFALMRGWGWDGPTDGTIADTILGEAAKLPGAHIRS